MSSGQAPYLSPFAVPGLVPETVPDVPISVVLLLFTVAMFVSANLINRQNKSNGTPFNFIILFVVWSVLRTAGLVMRIAAASQLDASAPLAEAPGQDKNVFIAASVFANAGGILLMILNMLLMPILMRAFFGFKNSAAGWRKKVATLPFLVPIPLVPIMLLVTVNVLTLSFFTTDDQTRANTVKAQKVALVVLTCVSFIPFLPALFVAASPSSSRPTFPEASSAPAAGGSGRALDRILRPVPGAGRLRTAALLVTFSSGIMTLNTAIRAATLFLPSRPMEDPAWYHGRAVYYIFTFALEIVVVAVYLVNRVDRRLQAPKPAGEDAEEEVKEKDDLEAGSSSQRPASRDDTLGDQGYEDEDSGPSKAHAV